MERDDLRLECLKLAAQKEIVIDEILHRAGEYEKFVLGSEPVIKEKPTTAVKGAGKVSTSKAGNVDIFS